MRDPVSPAVESFKIRQKLRTFRVGSAQVKHEAEASKVALEALMRRIRSIESERRQELSLQRRPHARWDEWDADLNRFSIEVSTKTLKVCGEMQHETTLGFV